MAWNILDYLWYIDKNTSKDISLNVFIRFKLDVVYHFLKLIDCSRLQRCLSFRNEIVIHQFCDTDKFNMSIYFC